MSDATNPYVSNMRYCDTHKSHWIPQEGASEKGSSCPWCQRDAFWDELENIHDVFLSAIRSKEGKGGQQVPYFGDFASIAPSVVNQMRVWVKRWDEILGRNLRRGG